MIILLSISYYPLNYLVNWLSNGIISLEREYFSFIVIRTLLNCMQARIGSLKKKKKKEKKKRNLACTHSDVYFSIAAVEQLCITMVHLPQYGRTRLKNEFTTRAGKYYYVNYHKKEFLGLFIANENEKNRFFNPFERNTPRQRNLSYIKIIFYPI